MSRTDTPNIELGDQDDNNIRLIEEQNEIKKTIKELVREFVELDGEITKAKDDLKVVQQRRNDIQGTIVKFMKDNNINSINISNGLGKIKLNQKTMKKPLGKASILEALQTKLSTLDLQDLMNELESHREEVEVEKIKLVRK